MVKQRKWNIELVFVLRENLLRKDRVDCMIMITTVRNKSN